MASLIDSAKHAVKLAATVQAGRAKLYAVDCRCGWQSALHQCRDDANRAYAEHKRTAA